MNSHSGGKWQWCLSYGAGRRSLVINQKRQYADGTVYKLRSPIAVITLQDGKPLPKEVLRSLRIPLPVFSRGLHDGRARTVEEAILWHGGEAEKSKEAFRTMSKRDRASLLRFLNSL